MNNLKFTKVKSLEAIVTLILILGILPSFTALSETLIHTFPLVFKWTGPINPLKLFFPILLFYCFISLNRLSSSIKKLYTAIFGIGTLSVLISGGLCLFPSAFMRDWAVFCLGGLAAFAFYFLPHKNKLAVVNLWVFIIGFFIFTDFFFPKVNNWFYQSIFDQSTRAGDFNELGTWALTGVWSRQSLAKILTYVPWIFAAFLLNNLQVKKGNLKNYLIIFLVFFISLITILSTSQRGPLLAQVLSLFLFSTLLIYRLKNIKILYLTITTLLISVVIMFTITPEELWKPRLLAPFRTPVEVTSENWKNATSIHRYNAPIHNITYRKNMLQMSMNKIFQNPLGHACIPESDFFNNGFLSPGHSHNFFLQGFLDRGWLWGILHLALWLLALISTLRQKSYFYLFIGCGIFSVIISGLFDYPWFVLNQSLLLHIFLLYGLESFYKGRSHGN